jgi:very-short-patch-repair endonuclease
MSTGPAPSSYFVAVGISRGQRNERYRQIGHDLWVPADAAGDECDRVRALWSSAPIGSALSYETAVRWYALAGDRREDGLLPHVTVPTGTNFDRKELKIHVARLTPDDVCTFNTARVTTPERTFLDIAGGKDRERLLVVGDGLLARGLTTIEAVQARVVQGRRARGVVVAREIAAMLDGRAQSPPESILRLRFRDAGVPRPELQFAIQTGSYVVHADMAWPEARTVLEYEGRQHAEHEQFALDIDRYSVLASLGWLVLRAGSRDLADRSEKLIARVVRTLRRRSTISFR